MISSYASLLLGCLMRSKVNKAIILAYIPGNSPVILIHVLRAFLAFQEDARVLTSEALVATSTIISELEKLLTVRKETVEEDADDAEEEDSVTPVKTRDKSPRKKEKGSPESSACGESSSDRVDDSNVKSKLSKKRPVESKALKAKGKKGRSRSKISWQDI